MRILAAVDRLLDRFYLWCGYAAAALLLALALLIIASIISRLIGAYVPGLTEYAGYAMGGASFLALAHTLRAGGHIRVGILLNAVGGRVRRGVQLWCLGMGTVLAVYLAWFLVRMTHVSWKLGDRSEGDDALLLWIPQTLLSFGSVVLAICFVHSLVVFLAGRDDPTVAKGGIAEGEI